MPAPSRPTGGSSSEAVQFSACDFEASRERRSTILLFASVPLLPQTNETSLASSSTNAKRRSQRSLFFTGPFVVRHLSSWRHRICQPSPKHFSMYVLSVRTSIAPSLSGAPRTLRSVPFDSVLPPRRFPQAAPYCRPVRSTPPNRRGQRPPRRYNCRPSIQASSWVAVFRASRRLAWASFPRSCTGDRGCALTVL